MIAHYSPIPAQEIAALIVAVSDLGRLKRLEGTTSKFLKNHGYYAPPTGFSSLEDLGDKISLSEKSITKDFEKLFNKQAAEANFEILSAPGAFSLFDLEGIIEVITKSPSSQMALSRLIDTEDSISALYGLNYIVNCFRVSFDTLTASLAIDKIARMAKTFNDPNDPNIQDALCALNDSRRSLIQLPCIDEDQASELSREIFKFTGMRSCQYFQWSSGADCPNSPQWKLLRLKASPFFVKTLNPSFFAQQLEDRGIDEAASDILVNSWEGTFSSFLDAAKTLSAES